MRISLVLCLMMLHTTVFGQCHIENDTLTKAVFPPFEERYLGQKPPRLMPEVFAPGIISTEKYVEGFGVFTPNMQAFYFTRQGGEFQKRTLFVSRYKDGKWNNPSMLSSDINQYKDQFEPRWSEIKQLEPFKSLPVRGGAVSDKGTCFIYFLEMDGSGHLSYSRLIDGEYEEPQKMSDEINSGKWIAHPFVAPDESYLMWDAEKEGEYGADIYISFKQEDGSWGPAINMGSQVNSSVYDQGPKVTPDGKYLFFWRGDEKVREDGSSYWVGSPYWMDAQIIETLRPKARPIGNEKALIEEQVINRSMIDTEPHRDTMHLENANFPALKARYFGEAPPHLIPKLFAPEFLSPEGLFEEGTFSPDMRTFYFSRKNGAYKKRTFFVVRYENGQWGEESETEIQYPRYSRDGNRMYKGNQYRVCTQTGWSELKSMGPPFTDKHIMGISVSNKGTFFFDEFERGDTVGAISYSCLVDGHYTPRQKMGEEINTGTWIAHPYIAPDESYLLWDVQREDGYGGSDIYISFQREDGTWLPAMNLGNAVNTELHESGVAVSPDGKYLFFSRGEWKTKEDGSTYWVGRPYWADIQIIENLRPKTR